MGVCSAGTIYKQMEDKSLLTLCFELWHLHRTKFLMDTINKELMDNFFS